MFKAGYSRRSKEEVLAAIRSCAIVPVVRVDDAEEAMCAAEGIVRARHPILELTLTVPNAFLIIEELSRRFGGDLIVGAGTVLNSAACNTALLAGAQFLVSPSTDVSVIQTANEQDVVCISGALTPTEILTASQAGADTVKIFPAGAVGGPQYIRSLKAPFPNIELIPSGGVDMGNLAEYLSSGAMAVAVGGLIFDRKSLQSRNIEAIAENTERFASAVRSARASKT